MHVPSSFDYAIIRVVPRVERGEFLNVGVLLFCSELDYLGARIELDVRRLQALAPGLDADTIQKALDLLPLVCAGGERAGVIGQLPAAKRFDWLVSPRSTVIQTSPVHTGLCSDPESALEHLLNTLVRPTGTAKEQEGAGGRS